LKFFSKEIVMSKFNEIFSGMNLRKALQIARELGCALFKPNRTGEMVVSHPQVPHRVRIKATRCDSPRALTTFLRKVARVTA
jgi:hypothetical protein